MAATQIAQNLAFINWTPPTGLALGSCAASVQLCHRSAGTSGFLGFTAACPVGFGPFVAGTILAAGLYFGAGLLV